MDGVNPHDILGDEPDAALRYRVLGFVGPPLLASDDASVQSWNIDGIGHNANYLVGHGLSSKKVRSLFPAASANYLAPRRYSPH